MEYRKQTGDNPHVLDGNFADHLTARSSGHSIAELWAYLLKEGGLKLQAMQVTGETPNMCVQTMRVHTTNPFATPDDDMFALSAYKNPMQKNKKMGMADNIDIDITPDKYIEFTVYPGVNSISLYFDKLN